MGHLNTAKILRFALATLLLGIGIGLLIAGGVGRLEEDRDNSTRAGAHVELPKHGEAEQGGVAGHGAQCSAQSGVRA